MIEGLNRVLETEREAKGIKVKGCFLVLQQNSEPMKFGGLVKITWKVHYTVYPSSTLIEVMTTAKPGRDDFKRDLAAMLQVKIYELTHSEKWEKVINGDTI